MIARVLTGIVGVAHLYFGYREIWDWKNFAGKILKIEPNSPFFIHTTSLAANQGLYNLFLGIGLLMAIANLFGNGSRNVSFFILICIIVAGIVGWITMNTTIFLLAQSAAALVALIACWFLWNADGSS